MVATEYYEAKWENYELFGDYVIVLGHWVIHTHAILGREKNTGYAFEGIVSAYIVAQTRKHEEALNEFLYTIDEGLYKLTSWQVNGPLAHKNKFLIKNPTKEKIATGGIMNSRNEPSLRIDTTQHQMHALIMALTSIYKQ
jgi:UDP-N-acetylmuramoyl-tripeptide--D-alanyl-D-alanine ligase